MKAQYQHSLTTSFMMWFDHHLLDKGEAYYNAEGEFFNYSDSRVADSFTIFGSAYKQFVNDASITGANVCSGVYVNNTWQDRNNGVIIDYINGRVLTTGTAATDTVTGAFTVKDFNVYFANETEEDLIIEKKYKPTSDFPSTNTFITPYDYTVPAIFINAETFRNDPFAFGGMDRTTSSIKAVILSDDLFKLDGVLSIFADTRHTAIDLLSFESYPINEYGDNKGGSFNYTGLADSSGNGKIYIDRVFSSKLSDRSKESLETDLFVGFLDFDVSVHRFPRL